MQRTRQAIDDGDISNLTDKVKAKSKKKSNEDKVWSAQRQDRVQSSTAGRAPKKGVKLLTVQS
jgi:hypothetical protein